MHAETLDNYCLTELTTLYMEYAARTWNRACCLHIQTGVNIDNNKHFYTSDTYLILKLIHVLRERKTFTVNVP